MVIVTIIMNGKTAMATTTLETPTAIAEATNTYMTFSTMFECRRYPAGESHIALTLPTQHVERITIEAAIVDFEGLGNMLTADQILRRNGIVAQWFVPYFPFARHDRRNHAGDGFELGVALAMVSHLDIVIADPHSDVAGQLPHIPQSASVECFRDAGFLPDDAVTVVPDAGATKKAHDWASGRIVQALKHRDTTTGRLSDFEVLADDLHGAPCLIVDDICDGGGTFLGLAAELATKNAGPLTLAVTHGVFTKGTVALTQAFDHIATFGFDGGSRMPGVDYLPFTTLYNKGARR